MREIAYVVATSFFGNDIAASELKSIVYDAFAFDAPLRKISDNTYILELFNGPTLTFKDYGARFTARLMQYLDSRKPGYKRNILVATTGNSGAATANGFFKMEGIKVSVLYPKGLLSRTQTAQFSSLGENIHPVEVLGTVDDCKRLLQSAISDSGLTSLNLTGANSINIARLIPQIAFSMHAYARLLAAGVKDADKAVYSMPCGNLSNLVATIMAKRMGLPTGLVIAATNANNHLSPLVNGVDTKNVGQTPIRTTAPSLDMTYPSGWPRLNYIYNGDLQAMKREILPVSVGDKDVADTINALRNDSGYTVDPHGAIAYRAATDNNSGKVPMVIFATGHPAKQLDIMTRITASAIELPVQLTRFMGAKRHPIMIPPTLPALRKHLLNTQ